MTTLPPALPVGTVSLSIICTVQLLCMPFKDGFFIPELLFSLPPLLLLQPHPPTPRFCFLSFCFSINCLENSRGAYWLTPFGPETIIQDVPRAPVWVCEENRAYSCYFTPQAYSQ